MYLVSYESNREPQRVTSSTTKEGSTLNQLFERHNETSSISTDHKHASDQTGYCAVQCQPSLYMYSLIQWMHYAAQQDRNTLTQHTSVIWWTSCWNLCFWDSISINCCSWGSAVTPWLSIREKNSKRSLMLISGHYIQCFSAMLTFTCLGSQEAVELTTNEKAWN